MTVPVRARLRRTARTLGLLTAALLLLFSIAGVALACVGPAEPTTTTTSLSGEGKSGTTITVLEGSKVKDQAGLEGKNAAKATGKISYSVYRDSSCKELVTKAGEFEFTEGKVPASEEVTLEAGKIYYWQAHYGGDSLDAESTSSCGGEVLSVKAATAISGTLSGEGVEGGTETGASVEVGDETAVTDSATLSGTNVSTATGTVKYRVYSDSECKVLFAAVGEGTVSGGKVSASSGETVVEPGTYYWQAEYVGDSLHSASVTKCGVEIEHADPEYKASAYAATLTGSPLNPGTPPEPSATFDFGLNREITCTGASYSGTLNNAMSELRLAPTYTGCKGKANWATFTTAKIEPNSCVFKLGKPVITTGGHYEATGGIVGSGCSGTSKMLVKVPETSPACEMELTPQDGIHFGFTVENLFSGKTLRIEPHLDYGYHVKKAEAGCGLTAGTDKGDGNFKGQFEVVASPKLIRVG